MSAEAAASQRPRVTWRWVELRMLLPLLILLPIGFTATNIYRTASADPGPMILPAIYIVMMLGAHFVLVATGNRGDPLLLPLVAAIGGVGIVMLNRLAPDLGTTSAFGLNLNVAETQLLWFAVGLLAMLTVAIGLRDDRFLRHYKYTWALAGIALLIFTFLFGKEITYTSSSTGKTGSDIWTDMHEAAASVRELPVLMTLATAMIWSHTIRRESMRRDRF